MMRLLTTLFLTTAAVSATGTGGCPWQPLPNEAFGPPPTCPNGATPQLVNLTYNEPQFGLGHGSIVDMTTFQNSLGVEFHCPTGPKAFGCMIFDSKIAHTTSDPDLKSPKSSKCVPDLGNILIIQENGDGFGGRPGTITPDDSVDGGIIRLEFVDGCVFINTFSHIDNQRREDLDITVREPVLISLDLDPVGDGKYRDVYVGGVLNICTRTFEIDVQGSMGFPGLSWWKCPDDTPVHGGGDPHFQRWGQRRDSFHGECDLVLVHSEQFANGQGFDLHARTTIDTYYSYIEGLALGIGDTVLEIEQDGFYVDGDLYSFDALPLKFGTSEDGMYVLEMTGHKKDSKNLALKTSSGNDIISFKVYKHFLQYTLGGRTDLSDAVGLLGQFSTGNMYGRDGQTFENFKEYAFEWQVRPDLDPSLFHEPREPQLPHELCRLPTAARPGRRQLRAANEGLYEQAEKACAAVVNNDHDHQLCVEDIMMTGDLGLTETWDYV